VPEEKPLLPYKAGNRIQFNRSLLLSSLFLQIFFIFCRFCLFVLLSFLSFVLPLTVLFRYFAQSRGTSYVYDIPAVFAKAITRSWRLKGLREPPMVLQCKELQLDKNNHLVPVRYERYDCSFRSFRSSR
jgi:hypothetical protein